MIKQNIIKYFKIMVVSHEKEYSKRLLTRIVNNSLLMMWGTYILAWCDKTEIAETLSKTIATSIIAVVIGYLSKSVIENISKHTCAFKQNNSVSIDGIDTQNENRDC